MKYYTQDVGASQAPIAQQPIVYAIDGLGKVVTAANVLVATVLIVAIYFDSNSATIAVLSGVGFFALSTSLTLLTLSGTLTHIIMSGQEQKTIRRRDELPYRVSVAPDRALHAIDLPQLPYAPPVALPQAPSYVAAVPRTSDTVRLAAASFVTQLFDTSTGRPLPSRITRNRSQIQWKSPAPEVVEYLESLGIIYQDGGRHLYFDGTHYPTLHDALNAMRSGVRKGTSEEGEEGRVR